MTRKETIVLFAMSHMGGVFCLGMGLMLLQKITGDNYWHWFNHNTVAIAAALVACTIVSDPPVRD